MRDRLNVHVTLDSTGADALEVMPGGKAFDPIARPIVGKRREAGRDPLLEAVQPFVCSPLREHAMVYEECT